MAVLIIGAYGKPTPSEQAASTSRTFAFGYQVHVPAAKDPAGKLYLCLPLPQQDDYQKIENLQIESVVAYKEGRDPDYHNPFVMFEPTAAQVESGFDATVRFVATRREHKVDLVSASAKIVAPKNAVSGVELQRYLEPDKMVPLNGVIRELAAQQTPASPIRWRRRATFTITWSPRCAMTNLAKAGDAATRCGRAVRNVATARTSIRF